MDSSDAPQKQVIRSSIAPAPHRGHFARRMPRGNRVDVECDGFESIISQEALEHQFHPVAFVASDCVAPERVGPAKKGPVTGAWLMGGTGYVRCWMSASICSSVRGISPLWARL